MEAEMTVRIGRPAAVLITALVMVLGACGGGADAGAPGGSVELDGSSTVYPISEAVAEEYAIAHGTDVRVTIGMSGTGGGFKRFCAGETAISNASRPIKDSERELCESNGIEYLELPIAIDGLAVVANPANTFTECLTVDELRRIWEPGSQVARWSEIRDGWPDEPIKLYGPGTNSGTFDYFTEAVMGEAGASRGDYTASEDDNVLVEGVIGDASALGYFGYAYYIENADRMKVLGVDDGAGCVTPREETVRGGTYTPLSRPLYLYVSRQALTRPEVAQFVEFYMESAAQLVPEVGYVPLEPTQYESNLDGIRQGGAS
jgi:phosphate transport system substrate-binding protein